jgi:restriction system protein
MEELNILSIFSQGMVAFWWAIPLILLGWLIESSWFKGKLGEFLVNKAFKKYLDPDTYFVLHNVTLPTEDGSTQIDHIVVSRFGIFVVETKNMSGWIFGSADNRKWTQSFHRRKFTFQNPLRQNFKHLKAVSVLTDIPDSKIHSLVIFTGSAKFKTGMPANVTRRTGGIKYIRSFDRELLSSNEASKAVDAIQAGRLAPGLSTDRKHLDGLARKHHAPTCSQCGSKMVKRTAKKAF